MKICIVTVYNSINAGSFLQAYALSKFLKREGHDVYFLKRPSSNSSSASVKNKLIKVCRGLKHGLKIGYINLVSILRFRSAIKYFSIISQKKINEMDCFIIGSDTIWNVNDNYFLENYETYFGKYLLEGKIITYAGSVGNSVLHDNLNSEIIKELIEKWKCISVRDDYTKKELAQFTDKPICKVCDPTFLLSQADYSKDINRTFKEKYIFVYMFDELNYDASIALKEFAKQKNLKIVQVTNNTIFNYSDRMMINSPFDFMAYISNAEYVVTDTFHGTVFSFIFNKQFAVIDRNKKKVEEILIDFDLVNRKVSEDENFTNVFNNVIDYKSIRYNEQIEKSREFLINSIEGIEHDYRT